MRKAISLAPDVPVYHLNLGLWYSVLGDTDSARRSFDALKGLSRTPAQSIFWNSQFFDNVEASNLSKGAESLIEKGYSILFADPAEALSLFSEALAQRPDNSRAKLASGIALVFLGNQGDALEVFDEAANNTSGEDATIISLWRMIASGERSSERIISAARFSPYSGIITPGFGNSYSVNAFSSYSIEALFLPQLRCFVVSPQANLHLVLMEEWFIMNSDMRLAGDIRQLLDGEETGLSSCLLVDNDS
jgi:tetratricopeptide (TPR) repeat protein